VELGELQLNYKTESNRFIGILLKDAGNNEELNKFFNKHNLLNNKEFLKCVDIKMVEDGHMAVMNIHVYTKDNMKLLMSTYEKLMQTGIVKDAYI